MQEVAAKSYTVINDIQTYKNGKLHVYRRGEVLSAEVAGAFENFGLLVGYHLRPNL